MELLFLVAMLSVGLRYYHGRFREKDFQGRGGIQGHLITDACPYSIISPFSEDGQLASRSIVERICPALGLHRWVELRGDATYR